MIIERVNVTIRPLLPDDISAAAAAGHTALEELYPEDLTPEEEASRIASATVRVAHLQRTDPGGCWVAEIDGQIAGAANSIIREGVWGLSLLAVLPDFQGRGIGTRLYAAALAYGADEPGGIILSSSHPAAMRRYARTPGYRLLPTVGLSGAWDLRRAPAALRCRPGDLAADAHTIDGASRHVRGASHMRDLPTALDRPGAMLLVIEDEGFACCRNGSLRLLAARTEAAAEDLLWGAITSGQRRGRFSYDFVTAENQWAIRVGLEAGLSIALGSPVFVRGEVGPMAPYLPSAAYL
ncbi:MAG: hypothetical protein QOH83_1558 [Solirubrobacteraceae bacterium]|nr:hypothetical protein [Solirubrobacteraceae bacterium]